VGEDRILWGTDSVWYGPPQPLIDAFRAFTIPDRMRAEFGYPELTPDVKQKILGSNATALYGVAPEVRPADELAWIEQAKTELAARLG
jgi:predicted TIM-barrel fold metal-dependent hydrolase